MPTNPGHSQNTSNGEDSRYHGIQLDPKVHNAIYSLRRLSLAFEKSYDFDVFQQEFLEKGWGAFLPVGMDESFLSRINPRSQDNIITPLYGLYIRNQSKLDSESLFREIQLQLTTQMSNLRRTYFDLYHTLRHMYDSQKAQAGKGFTLNPYYERKDIEEGINHLMKQIEKRIMLCFTKAIWEYTQGNQSGNSSTTTHAVISIMENN